MSEKIFLFVLVVKKIVYNCINADEGKKGISVVAFEVIGDPDFRS